MSIRFYHPKSLLKLINSKQKMKSKFKNNLKFKLTHILNAEKKPINSV